MRPGQAVMAAVGLEGLSGMSDSHIGLRGAEFRNFRPMIRSLGVVEKLSVREPARGRVR
ncbi:predicted protein [Streptomyces viridosporus ATCC 14672]|uniref:Predicted protein n=1 Tax=Streptomyces viridosporus (strain ATCC 14672 / DSM 40746 / JCM 4963 / KCTC 9882 / NRRL B-12104 / FH 1290) TaxID=566461 RepID=D6A173_STRV1|nr:predicted protein [Streptomyces viridosporus ATCC 14672]